MGLCSCKKGLRETGTGAQAQSYSRGKLSCQWRDGSKARSGQPALEPYIREPEGRASRSASSASPRQTSQMGTARSRHLKTGRDARMWPGPETHAPESRRKPFPQRGWSEHLLEADDHQSCPCPGESEHPVASLQGLSQVLSVLFGCQIKSTSQETRAPFTVVRGAIFYLVSWKRSFGKKSKFYTP